MENHLPRAWTNPRGALQKEVRRDARRNNRSGHAIMFLDNIPYMGHRGYGPGVA
jgi:hypothetical protein